MFESVAMVTRGSYCYWYMSAPPTDKSKKSKAERIEEKKAERRSKEQKAQEEKEQSKVNQWVAVLCMMYCV